VSYVSGLKAVALFLVGGALMGLVRGSMITGVLSGVILLALAFSIALPVVIFDYLGRIKSPPTTPTRETRAIAPNT
jgi:hypothetical protein